ncbi:hypothetical protein JZU61_04280 [bacterium]|jgi:hypothetical protein|nr:hypothetical protein [bacterium]
MKEKILALLLAKFAGVRKDALAQMARTLALSVTTDDEAKTLVEKFTSEQVDEFAKDFRKDVDKEVSDATKTHEGNLKKKYDLIEKKEPTPGDPDPKPGDPKDLDARLEAMLQKHIKPLQDRLAGYESEGVKKTRLQTLEGKLKDVPETFKAQKLKDFGRMNFETDEAFNEYLTETETDLAGFKQELADKGLSGHTKPIMGGQNKDGVSTGVASFIAEKTAEKPALTGKEV